MREAVARPWEAGGTETAEQRPHGTAQELGVYLRALGAVGGLEVGEVGGEHRVFASHAEARTHPGGSGAQCPALSQERRCRRGHATGPPLEKRQQISIQSLWDASWALHTLTP